MTMVRLLFFPAACLAGLLFFTVPVRAGGELIPLGGTADARVQTLQLIGNEADDLELIHRRFYGGYYGGYGRGFYGGYGRGYYGGYGHGFYGARVSFNIGYGYRPYYGGYGYGYRPYYGYGYRPYYYGAYYSQPYYYYPSYSYSYYTPAYTYYPSAYCSDYYYPINGNGRTMPYATVLGNNGYVPTPGSLYESAPSPQPSGDGTYPYDGGPSRLVPMPGNGSPDQSLSPRQPLTPPKGILVYIPGEEPPALTYPAYGEELQPVRQPATALVKQPATPAPQADPVTPRPQTGFAYPAYGEHLQPGSFATNRTPAQKTTGFAAGSGQR
jgi:hypothetical protein